MHRSASVGKVVGVYVATWVLGDGVLHGIAVDYVWLLTLHFG
jgi:hypothetical protein